MKWLKKIPQSGEQVLAVINEANEAYLMYKKAQKQSKTDYEKALNEQGIFVGSIVVVDTKQDNLGNRYAKVEKILGQNVNIRFLDDKKGWKLKGFSYKLIQT